MIKVYGIPNCDTIKKTLKWLDGEKIEHEFHNYRVEGITRGKLEAWLEQQPLEKLLNKTSATWKKLTDEQKAAAADKGGAVEVMLENPTVIKRPVIENENGKVVAVGFKEPEYETLFKDSSKK